MQYTEGARVKARPQALDDQAAYHLSRRRHGDATTKTEEDTKKALEVIPQEPCHCNINGGERGIRTLVRD